MHIVATASEIMKFGDWEEFCETNGINPYEEFDFSIEEAAALGLLDSVIERRPVFTGSPSPSPVIYGTVGEHIEAMRALQPTCKHAHTTKAFVFGRPAPVNEYCDDCGLDMLRACGHS